MSAIVLQGVAVEIARRSILGPIDLELPEGSYTLVVGPSGSGKTTLLRVIAGLAAPARGTVRAFGAEWSQGARLAVPPERRRVGYVFQGGALWPHWSVRRTIEFVLSCRGVPRRERAARVTELVALVELAGFEDRRPGELSGGEAQRLSLARALALDPRVLLLDEPLGPLDVELREALVKRIGDLHDRLGLTTIHVTHDPREVEHLADRRVRLDHGRIAASHAGADGFRAGDVP